MTDQTIKVIKSILAKSASVELTIRKFQIVSSFVYIGWFSEIDLNCGEPHYLIFTFCAVSVYSCGEWPK